MKKNKFNGKSLTNILTAIIFSATVTGIASCNQSPSFDTQNNPLPSVEQGGFSAAAVSGQILIKRKKGVKPTNSFNSGFKNIRNIKEIGVEVVTVTNTNVNSISNVLKNLNDDPSIEYA